MSAGAGFILSTDMATTAILIDQRVANHFDFFPAITATFPDRVAVSILTHTLDCDQQMKPHPCQVKRKPTSSLSHLDFFPNGLGLDFLPSCLPRILTCLSTLTVRPSRSSNVNERLAMTNHAPFDALSSLVRSTEVWRRIICLGKSRVRLKDSGLTMQVLYHVSP